MTVRIDCWCITCDETIAQAQGFNQDFLASVTRTFIVCPECGNKRCPRATQHDHACTGSNEPGQEGSVYRAATTRPPATVDELWARLTGDDE